MEKKNLILNCELLFTQVEKLNRFEKNCSYYLVSKICFFQSNDAYEMAPNDLNTNAQLEWLLDHKMLAQNIANKIIIISFRKR